MNRKILTLGCVMLALGIVALEARGQGLLPLAREQAMADALLQRVPVSEVLGPLAPVALSPFFGLLCLSGIALLSSQGWLPENLLLSGNPLLSNTTFFGILLILTLLTSLPKLFTVSKLFAQAMDQVEAYAGLILFLIVYLLSAAQPAPGPVYDLDIQQAGVLSVSWAVLLMLACIVNFVVINTVKFFFEVIALITPIPLLDAAFEIANKSLSFILIALYAYHPLLALIPGLILFLICLPIYLWARRGMIYYKSILLDPLWKEWVSRRRGRRLADVPPGIQRRLAHDVGEPLEAAVKVFPDRAAADAPRKALCYLAAVGGRRYLVRLPRLRAPVIVPIAPQARLVLRRGLLTHRVQVFEESGALSIQLSFSRYYTPELAALCERLGMVEETAAGEAAPQWSGTLLGKKLLQSELRLRP